jgi:hypothetical protein
MLSFSFIALLAAPALGQNPPDPSRSDACECGSAFKGEEQPGTVWTGSSPVRLSEIASALAPILWFSSDEPLIVLRQNPAVPHAHPCDKQSAQGVVYYQATDIVLRTR